MIEQVLQLLRANQRLNTLIQGRIEPFSIGLAANSIVYSVTPLTDNRITQTDKLEIHIIADSVANMFAIDNEVRKTILTMGDSPLTTDILQVEINGGGSMEDLTTNTKHLITYYYIVSKGVK